MTRANVREIAEWIAFVLFAFGFIVAVSVVG